MVSKTYLGNLVNNGEWCTPVQKLKFARRLKPLEAINLTSVFFNPKLKVAVYSICWN